MKEPNLDDLHQLRNIAFSRAKRWWGFGVAFGYLAIVAVPVAWLVGWQEWAGPLTAVVLAISGRVFVWRSENYREDAEWVLRTIELNRGIGFGVDATKIADLRLKYFDAVQRHGRSASHGVYFEASGDPSYALLIRMERESAWWTGQLAKKASQAVIGAFAVVTLMMFLAIAVGGLEVNGGATTSAAAEVFRRAYGLAIFAILLFDTLNLGVKYHRLSMAAQASMEQFTMLLDQVDDICAPRIMNAVCEYQSARKDGPPIPDCFKRCHERSLQIVWDETLSIE